MLESSLVYTITRTLPESLVLVLSGLILLGIGIDIDKSKVIKKGMLLGFIIGIIRLLPINFGVHSILSMVALGVILFKCSNNDIIKSMVSTCLVWLSLALSEGIYVLIATNILNIKIEKLMDNSSLQGAIITLPLLVIMFLIVIILKYIKDDILKVISSYAEIDEDGLEIKMSKTRSETDDKPVSALVANIPLKNIKERKI